MNANVAKNLLTILAASSLLAGCGVAPLPVTPTNGGYFDNPRAVRQQATPMLPAGVEAKRLSLDPANAIARVGESVRLNVKITGSDGKSYSDPRLVVWQVSNPQAGVVDQNGVLRPLIPGSVKVTATIGGLSAESTVQIDQARYAWQQMMSPTNKDLRAVKMVSKHEAWAGGDRGTLLRYINGAWHPERTFNYPSANVRGLGFANSNEGWAVGERGEGVPFIAHYKQGMWRMVNLPIKDGFLNAISVVNERDAWAVGQEGNGDAAILHWDGHSWKAHQSPVKGKLNDVQMLSNKRGWAVGKGSGSIPLILKFVDGAWQKNGLWNNRDTVSVTASLELKAIKMVSETQGYAVGVRDPLLLGERGLFLEYDPKRDGWQQGKYDGKVENLDQVPLHDIEMISGTEGWALGETRRPDFQIERNPQSIFGNLLANDGGVLKLDTNYFSGNLTGSFYAIDLLPEGEGFVVGQGGYILQRTYDWRGLNQGGYDNYGGGYGNSQQQPVTYGPGGQAVPGAQPTPRVSIR